MLCNEVCHGFFCHGTFNRSLILSVIVIVICHLSLHGSPMLHAPAPVPVPVLRNTKRTSGVAQDDAHFVTYR